MDITLVSSNKNDFSFLFFKENGLLCGHFVYDRMDKILPAFRR